MDFVYGPGWKTLAKTTAITLRTVMMLLLCVVLLLLLPRLLLLLFLLYLCLLLHIHHHLLLACHFSREWISITASVGKHWQNNGKHT